MCAKHWEGCSAADPQLKPNPLMRIPGCSAAVQLKTLSPTNQGEFQVHRSYPHHIRERIGKAPALHRLPFRGHRSYPHPIRADRHESGPANGRTEQPRRFTDPPVRWQGRPVCTAGSPKTPGRCAPLLDARDRVRLPGCGVSGASGVQQNAEGDAGTSAVSTASVHLPTAAASWR